MKKIGEWIKGAVRHVCDPDHDERIQEITSLLHQGLNNAREKFSIVAFAEYVGCTDRDLEIAKRNVYRTIIDRAWRDDKVTVGEQTTLRWVTDRLAIPVAEATTIQHQAARNRFALVLTKVMDDGVLDAEESKYLRQIAQSVGLSLGEFVDTYFRTEGEDFLRGIFAACTQGGALFDDAWTNVIAATERLGLPRPRLVEAILPQALRFMEHAFADAKSDGELSEEEEAYLKQLIQTLELPTGSRKYVDHNIAALRTIRLARHGSLPVENTPSGTAIRAGEIVHFHAPATWLQKRVLKSGDRWDSHTGTITITDNRILFSGDTRSFDVRYARIVYHEGRTGQILLQRMEKPESVIQLAEDEPVAYAILESAIALSYQTRRSRDGLIVSRHISREVRQRTWQRYSGRCAECGATDYLEFDHVIPVAKGGSNSDANVQLLCRACNLKKSDRI